MDMHGNALRSRATPVDARSLHVECPEHKGLILPVTNVKVSHTNNTERSASGVSRQTKLYLEALCVYCDRYHYLEVEQGSIAGLPALHE